MKSGSIELRWAYVAFGLLAGIDVLAGIRILRRMVWHLEPPAPDAPLFVLLFLLLHVVLLWLFHRLRNLLRYDQRLRAMYEQELGFAQQLLDASTEGLLMFGPEGNIVYANRRAGEVMGYAPEALLGQRAQLLVTPEDQAALQEQWVQVWAQPQQVYHLRVYDAEGQVRRVRVTASPRWHQGLIVGSFGVVHPE
ncbi:PAS domain-containing protein [Deinococcus sp. PESE-13]